MVQSLREYITAIGRLWWVVVVGFVSGALGLVQDMVNSGILSPIFDAAGLPPAAWYLLSVTAIGIGPFAAFHKLRQERDAALTKGPTVSLEATFETVQADLPTGVLTVTNGGPQTARIRAYATWRGAQYDLVWQRTEVGETELLPRTQDVARVLYLVSNTARLAYWGSPSSGKRTIDLEFQNAMGTDSDGYLTGEPLPEHVRLTITSDALTEPIVKRLMVTPTRVWEV